MSKESVITVFTENREKFYIPKTVLVVAAHPDDTEINAGGLIAALIDNQTSVHYLICSNGDKGSWNQMLTHTQLSEIRRREQMAAAQILGVASVNYLDIPDGYVAESMTLMKEKIAHALRELKPQMVITHDPWKRYDFNDDHRATGFATAHAVLLASNRLYLLQHQEEGLEPHFTPMITFFNTDNPNLWVDITDYYQKKEAAIRIHESQFSNRQTFLLELEGNAITQGGKINKRYGEAHHLEINS